MAIEQDTTERDALRPQTPAARRRTPSAHERTAAERERLREESRARRRARTDGQVVAPEPKADEITVRRLPHAAPPTEAAPPPTEPPSPPVQPAATPSPSALKPSTPAAGALSEKAGPEALREERAPASPPPPPRPARTSGSPVDPPAPRERVAALLGIASAIGVFVCLAATLGSGDLPGFGGGLRAEAKSRVVAPGGWLTLTGHDAPGGADVTLESRSGDDGPWHAFAETSAAEDGDFVLRGRVLQRPGQIEVRARVPGAGTTSALPIVIRPLRLVSVGDINLADAPANPWRPTAKLLQRADLAFANLETAVSTRGEPFPKQYNFRAAPAALATLRRQSGIDVLNLANNHVGDYGAAAMLDTVRGVERLGMKAVGAGPDLGRALEPQVIERLGLRIAFVGFSEIAPIEFAAAPGQPGTAWADPEQIANAIQAARRKADIVVATFHWGIERQTLETARQRELADVAVRNGAQVVIGAHPHTLQPVRRQGGAIVAYSLGNFVFAAESPETTSSGLLQLDLTAEGVTRGSWRAARISGGRPVPDQHAPRRLPLRDDLAMQAGVNLPEL